jgi:small-conductance mechanosensitive channel
MIRPQITNKLDGQFLSLFFEAFGVFSCQQSSPTTLDESSSHSISYIIIAIFFLLFLKLAAH